ncbi:hypothetical protein AVEN_141747-1, partial [Araneus ventricosus]
KLAEKVLYYILCYAKKKTKQCAKTHFKKTSKAASTSLPQHWITAFSAIRPLAILSFSFPNDHQQTNNSFPPQVLWYTLPGSVTCPG